jgi:thiamine-monophosphate kinase
VLLCVLRWKNREAMETTEQTLADVGEFGLIELLAPLFPQHDRVLIGPGDDSAVLRITSGHVVVTTDLMAEGKHFRRDWAEPQHVGGRAAAQNLADISAMGGQAHSLTIGLAAPADLPVDWVRSFAEGFAEECAVVGASVIGGDVTGADKILIAVTALGDCEQVPVRRSGAQVGNVVALAGRQGWAAGGLAVLSRGFRSPRALVDAYRKPSPPYHSGARAAAAGATAMIDVSDGLLAETAHIASASKVAIDISSASLDIAEPLQAVAAATGQDPLRFILSGGDDHSLLATFPLRSAVPEEFVVIGEVLAGQGVTVDGAPYEGSPGFTHF